MEKVLELNSGKITVNICNKCSHHNLATKSCDLKKDEPIKLNTFTTATGFIYLLKPSDCTSEPVK
jgi:hypothetical protein